MHETKLRPIVQALSSTEPLDPSQDERRFRHLYVENLHLGKFGGALRSKDAPVLASLRTVFEQYVDALRIPEWQAIYSVPLLPKLAPAVLGIVGVAGLCQLTSAHVYEDRSTNPDECVVHRLVDLIDRPCTQQGVDRREFIADPELRTAILGTGGGPRDLLRVLRLAALFAYESPQPPIDRSVVEASFDDWQPVPATATGSARPAAPRAAPQATKGTNRMTGLP